MMPLAIALLLSFACGAMVGQLAERDRTDLPRARATWRQRRAWRKERLSVPRIPNGWRS